jgi:hypothetical protein
MARVELLKLAVEIILHNRGGTANLYSAVPVDRNRVRHATLPQRCHDVGDPGWV